MSSWTKPRFSIRLWKEKRGEAEPEDLTDNLVETSSASSKHRSAQPDLV